VVADFGGATRDKSMTPASFLDAYQDKSMRIPDATHVINVHGEFTSIQRLGKAEEDVGLACDLDTIHITPLSKKQTE